MVFKKKNPRLNSISRVVEENVGIPSDIFLATEPQEPFIEGIAEAVKIILQFIDNDPTRQITIVGDYDSDGINATAIMYWSLMTLQRDLHVQLNIVTRLPRRLSEGYGLSEKISDEIPEGSLLITVDNGIAAKTAVEKAKNKGITVIITDHHLPSVTETGEYDLPGADVIVDPHVDNKSEFADYCGAALAYRLGKALVNKELKPLLVLAAIATVTDIVPLVGDNRRLLKRGLDLINEAGGKFNPPGLQALLKETNLSDHITEDDFGFTIGPIFNAAGRLIDDGASHVLDLLKCSKNDATASERADKLIEAKSMRKLVVKQCIPRTEAQVRDFPIVIYDPSIGEGIIGIVAGNLVEKYNCPAIVFTDSGKIEKPILKGSARSIPEIHLKHTLDTISDLMIGYGGHAGAAGLSIQPENLEKFRTAFTKAVGPLPEHPDTEWYDLELKEEDIPNIMSELKKFAPFGEGNPKIRFHLECDIPENLNEDQIKMGDGSHFKFWMKTYSIVGFGLMPRYKELGCPTHLNMIGTLTESWFNGSSSVKYQVESIM